MISSVPDGFTRFIKTEMMFLASGVVPSFASRSLRFSDPIMLIPPLKSTPNFGGHLETIISDATKMLTATTAARPE